MTVPPPPNVPPFVGATGAPARFTVPSSLDGVTWSTAAAVPGSTVVLSARAMHVGTGAPCTVEVAEQNGRVVWQGEGTLTAGRFRCEVAIPADLNPACRALVGQVRLPEHGLDGSALLAIEPLPEVTGVTWSAAEAAPGQTVTLRAEVRRTPEQAGVVEVIRQGPSGLACPVGEAFAVALADGRMGVPWTVPDAEGLGLPAPAERTAPEADPPLFFRLHVGRVTTDSPSLRVLLPRAAAPADPLR